MGRKLKTVFQKIFSFFADCISFNSPQAIVFNLSIILLILFIIPTSVAEESPFKCVFKHIIFPIIFKGNCPTEGFFADCDCPGCGLTRGISNLLHGNIKAAQDLNILSMPVLLGMILVIGINVFKIFNKQN